MKKILLLLPILALSISTNAQTKFGVKAGVNVSNLSGFVQENTSKSGIYAGGYASIKIDEKVTFQPEFLYSSQGTVIKDIDVAISSYTIVKSDMRFNLNYINIPLMFKYHTSERFNLEVGPQIGFLTSSKGTIMLDRANNNNSDLSDLYKTFDAGLNFGLGYELTNGFNFGARYNLGLANISKIINRSKNSVFSFGVGYSFK